MREDDLSSVVLLPKLIDNSRVVRQADPRANRELLGLSILVGIVVAGLVFYAWPHLAARETGNATNRLSLERDRLVEENRKLHLEKASLEDLHRVERIATKRLGLELPTPEQVIVVEKPRALPEGAHVARQGEVLKDAAN
jgi:cell division protein FtsL